MRTRSTQDIYLHQDDDGGSVAVWRNHNHREVVPERERERFFMFAFVAFGSPGDRDNPFDNYAQQWVEFRREFFADKLDAMTSVSDDWAQFDMSLTDFHAWCKRRGQEQ